jgi:hypothetical protein
MSYPFNFDLWNDTILGAEYNLVEEGRAILRARNKQVDAIVDSSTMNCRIYDDHPDHNEVPWWDGSAANCPPFLTSETGHALASWSGTFGLLWSVASDGKVYCSLRSNGDYDVSAIAKKFGGGGHKNAAGFETDLLTLSSWLRPLT